MENVYTTRVHGFPNLTGRVWVPEQMTEEGVLSLVVVLGSSVSLVGLVFAFITYSLFSDLRNVSGTTLMNLLAALFMAQLLYVIGVGGVQDPELCIALGFSLQYIRLTVFCWLTAMTHDMYMTFKHSMSHLPVTDPRISYSFCKYSLFGWGTPLILIALAMHLQFRNKIDISSLSHTNCWFLDHDAFMYGFVVPVLVLLFADVVFLARSATVARITISLQIDTRTRDKMRRKRRLQLWLFLKVIVLITTVAALGVLSKLTGINAFWVAFNVGQGIQGIAVALCVTCNCQVLKIYTRSLRRRKRHSKQSKYNPVSKTTSLQQLTWQPEPQAL